MTAMDVGWSKPSHGPHDGDSVAFVGGGHGLGRGSDVKNHCHLVGVMAVLRREAGVVENAAHGLVLPQRAGHEPFDSIVSGFGGQTFQEEGGEAATVVCVGHHKAHFGLFASRRTVILGDGDNVITPDGHQSKVVSARQVSQIDRPPLRRGGGGD